MENESKKSNGKRGGKRPNAGRPKGSVDKGGKLIRDMITLALDQVGGTDYLARTAESHPAAFLSLIGKVMPVQVTGENGGALQHSVKITFG